VSVNLRTGQVGVSWAKLLKFGAGAVIGFEFSFNPDRYAAIEARCGGVVWGEPKN
jgi:hypothetical protein